MNRKIAINCTVGMAMALLFLSFQALAITTKELVGAWGYGPAQNRTVLITTDKIFSVATYDLPGKKFISAYGGTWQVNGNTLRVKLEWNSADPDEVGQESTHILKLEKGKLHILDRDETYTRLDNGKTDPLAGAWIITGNYKDDQVSKRPNPFHPRRTMKVLSGNYFHWIAYNVETKQFMNAGGGTYATTKDQYTESIEFFTKTPDSVGKKVSFGYSIVNGDWRHKGEKSTGGPMDECWSRRETLEKQP
jgi:hypothetical protein